MPLLPQSWSSQNTTNSKWHLFVGAQGDLSDALETSNKGGPHNTYLLKGITSIFIPLLACNMEV